MNHVITGYEPTGPGEIALGAFTLAMNDNDANWLQFVANLVIHEAGLLKHGSIEPKASTMTRTGATDLVGEAFAHRHALRVGLQPGRPPRHGRLAARIGASVLQRRADAQPHGVTGGTPDPQPARFLGWAHRSGPVGRFRGMGITAT